MATTRAETQFRIDYPNSRARASRIFALDAISADAMRKITEDPWVDAHFITVGTGTIDPNIPLEDALILTDANGKAVQLSAELEGADVVVLIGSTFAFGRGAREGLPSSPRQRVGRAPRRGLPI